MKEVAYILAPNERASVFWPVSAAAGDWSAVLAPVLSELVTQRAEPREGLEIGVT